MLNVDGQGPGGGSSELGNFHGRHMCFIPFSTCSKFSEKLTFLTPSVSESEKCFSEKFFYLLNE